AVSEHRLVSSCIERVFTQASRDTALSSELARALGRRYRAAARWADADRPHVASGWARCRHLADAHARPPPDAGRARQHVRDRPRQQQRQQYRPAEMAAWAATAAPSLPAPTP